MGYCDARGQDAAFVVVIDVEVEGSVEWNAGTFMSTSVVTRQRVGSLR